jgi:hypothetical protein
MEGNQLGRETYHPHPLRTTMASWQRRRRIRNQGILLPYSTLEPCVLSSSAWYAKSHIEHWRRDATNKPREETVFRATFQFEYSLTWKRSADLYSAIPETNIRFFFSGPCIVIQFYYTKQRNAQFDKLMFNFCCVLYVSNLVGSSSGRQFYMHCGTFWMYRCEKSGPEHTLLFIKGLIPMHV